MSRKGRKEKKEKKKVEKASKVAAKAQAKPKKKSKTTDKWKKKAWYTIIAPEEFERRELGETIAEKPETLIGRLITVQQENLQTSQRNSTYN